jgi:4-hydroxyphenylpyruvate dioxygenase
LQSFVHQHGCPWRHRQAEGRRCPRCGCFDQIEFWHEDLDGNESDPEAFGKWIRQQSLALTDYQPLRDFEGAPDGVRERKRAEALGMLEIAVKLGTTTVLTTASSDSRCLAHRIDEDMRWLAREAASRNLKIAYEAVAWSAVNYTLKATWELVQRLAEPNLGVVVDTFHIFARNCDARELAGIPVDRIFLVQLSDVNLDQLSHPESEGYLENVIHVARHQRLLPGQGQLPLETILHLLREANYRGPVGVEVFNDGLKALNPEAVAREAFSALQKVCSK